MVWDSALALSLFMRSELAPQVPSRARVIELGAGVGLPGLDYARRHPQSVRQPLKLGCLTDREDPTNHATNHATNHEGAPISPS